MNSNNITKLYGEIRCPICGQWRVITHRAAKRANTKSPPGVCLSCSVKRTMNKPEIKEECSKNAKKNWENQEYKDKVGYSQELLHKSSEYRNKISESLKKAYSNQELRDKNSKTINRVWSNKAKKESILKRRKLIIDGKKCIDNTINKLINKSTL